MHQPGRNRPEQQPVAERVPPGADDDEVRAVLVGGPLELD